MLKQSSSTGSCQVELVAALDDAVRSDHRPRPVVDAVTGALIPFLRRPDLLTTAQRTGNPAGYRQRVLYVADDGAFSVVALVWLPGQATPIHDHLSWCVVGVHQGEESETRYRLVDDRLVVEQEGLTSPTGTVAGLIPPGDIHRVTNAGNDVAISLHVYGADLRQRPSSIRRCYDLPISRA
ncbi:MAG: hypothetical protein ACR2KO_13910 [Geodermatophilaceae bacterium]